MSKTLHYNFAADKSLVARTGPTLGITRTTEATYFDSAGVMQTAASGAARFDHLLVSPFTSLGLLVEEARTNIVLRSQDFTTSWSVGGDALAIVGSEALAPDGTMSGTLLSDNSAGGSGNDVYVSQNKSIAINTVFTCSVFAKASGEDWVYVSVVGIGGQFCNAYFDLTNGVAGPTVGADVISTFVEECTNGWYRCGFTFTSDTVDTTGSMRIYAAEDDGDFNVPLDGTSSIFIWGASIEIGAFPTTYIPTVAATVTRNKDSITTSDVTWFNQTGVGSWYAHAYMSPAANSFISIDDNGIFNISDQSNSDIIQMRINNGTDDVRFEYVNSAGDNSVMTSAIAVTPGTEMRLAVGMAEDDGVSYYNGGNEVTDSALDLSAENYTIFAVGDGRASLADAKWNAPIAEIAYFDERLDNDTLKDYSDNGIPSGGAHTYIAVTRRTAAQMRPKQRMAKPKRGLFRD